MYTGTVSGWDCRRNADADDQTPQDHAAPRQSWLYARSTAGTGAYVSPLFDPLLITTPHQARLVRRPAAVRIQPRSIAFSPVTAAQIPIRGAARPFQRSGYQLADIRFAPNQAARDRSRAAAAGWLQMTAPPLQIDVALAFRAHLSY
jgi:hypothetical protein